MAKKRTGKASKVGASRTKARKAKGSRSTRGTGKGIASDAEAATGKGTQTRSTRR